MSTIPVKPTETGGQQTRLGRSIGPMFIGLLIIAPAASPALTLWADNVEQIPKAYRLGLVAFFFALVGLLLFWLTRRLVSDSRVAAFIMFFALLALTSGGQILDGRSWTLRWAVALGGVGLAIVIVLRLRGWWLLDAIVLGSAAALLIPPVLTGTLNSLTGVEIQSPPSIAPSGPPMVQTPDVVLVVLDAYTSLPVLRELFGFEDATLPGDLARGGLTVVEPAFSSYSMTHLSVSSLLDLGYVAEDVPTTTTRDGRPLSRVLSGSSHLVETLAQNDYRITMVEPGWHMSACGDQVDVCVSDPFIDEGVGVVLSQSLLWSFLEPSIGSGFTNGARHAMAWTEENIHRVVNDGRSDFVFVHVLAPHPPLLLDETCQVVSEGRRLAGESMAVGGVDPSTADIRLEAYVDQVLCVNGFLRELSSAVSGSNALVFITGDHGGDSLSQLVTDPTRWSDSQVLERMSVFTAVKATSGCEDISSLVTVALFRALVSCAGDLGLDPIDERSFLVTLAEDGQQEHMRVLEAPELTELALCLISLSGTRGCS